MFEPDARAGDWLSERSQGALVQMGDKACFYPITILAVREVINNRFDDSPVAVTYCSLCDTVLTCDRRIGGDVLRFGASGLLRNRDLVMRDDATVRLWQQVTGEGIVGSYAGALFVPISTAIVSYGQFCVDHPDGLSLSRAVARIENVANPYVGHTNFTGPNEDYLSEPIDETPPPMSRVVGVTFRDGSAKAYPFGDLRSARVVNDVVGTGVAFDRRVGGRALTFDAVGDGFVDRETASGWSILGRLCPVSSPASV